jgi:hypothetical protein
MVCDCRDLGVWLSTALFPGKGTKKDKNISYEVHAKELKEVFEQLDLSFSKVTHIFRVGGARHLDQYGVDDSVRATCRGQLMQALTAQCMLRNCNASLQVLQQLTQCLVMHLM